MKKTLIALALTLTAPLAHADYEGSIRVVDACTTIAQIGQMTYDMKQANAMTYDQIMDQANKLNAESPAKTEWAKHVQSARMKVLNYAWKNASSERAAYDNSFGMCMDDLRIFQ